MRVRPVVKYLLLAAALPLAAVTGSVLTGPPWRDAVAAAASPIVADIQRHLATLGYEPGPADGLIGSRTRAAILRYQRDRGLRVDGRATAALREHLVAAVSADALPDAPLVEVEIRADPATVTRAAALRPTADAAAPAIRRLSAGSRVEVTAQSRGWAKVRAGGDTGWIRADAVRLDGAEPAGEQAGAGVLRGITGRVRGSREAPPEAPVTIGIRGLTPADVRNAQPDMLALRRLDGYAVGEPEARARAAALGLVSVAVARDESPVLPALPALPDAGGPTGATDR